MKIYEVEVLSKDINLSFETLYVVAEDYSDVLKQIGPDDENFLYINHIKFFSMVYGHD